MIHSQFLNQPLPLDSQAISLFNLVYPQPQNPVQQPPFFAIDLFPNPICTRIENPKKGNLDDVKIEPPSNRHFRNGKILHLDLLFRIRFKGSG
jgi:hypothetical protein